MLSKDDLKAIEDIVKPIKVDLEEVKETTNANNLSLMSLEKEIGIYSDALDIERKRVDKHEERISQLEVS